jgi:hypothetical protein
MPVSVKRASDGKSHQFELGPENRVNELKALVKAQIAPQFPHGCRLKFRGKVMKSHHRLKHYGVHDGAVIEMHDEKNWSSSSSSSDSDRG